MCLTAFCMRDDNEKRGAGIMLSHVNYLRECITKDRDYVDNHENWYELTQRMDA